MSKVRVQVIREIKSCQQKVKRSKSMIQKEDKTRRIKKWHFDGLMFSFILFK